MIQSSPDDYNDKNYPIEPIWALKSTLVSLIALPFLVLFFTFLSWGNIQSFSSSTHHDIRGFLYLGFFISAVPFHFFANVIRRATFHYQFDDKFLNLKQGLIRKQNRQLPFGVIQNVIVARGLLDRLFGLATITIQNATQSNAKDIKAQVSGSAGFFGNTIQIPGLTYENAEIIKDALLKKIKESPIIELGM